ncbi:MAG: hypothetical protein IKQ70_09325 [Bacteroidales bacterium]|nr:hypothetical protein [Bacteroidales bacterium]
MKPIKIVIEGDFIDCQIYRGRLYLWTINGNLCVYDWDLLVNYFAEFKSRDYTALQYAFINGRSLYIDPLKSLFEDKDFRTLLFNKFKSIESSCLYLNQYESKKFLIGEMDVPTHKLPIDTEIYSNKLYFATEDGLFKTTAHRKNDKYPVSSKPQKLWDARVLSIKANKFPQIAISAGSDGLYELNNSDEENLKMLYNDEFSEEEKNIFKISQKHSSFANYSYLSIYSTSLYGESYLAYFDWNEKLKNEEKYRRQWKQEYSESDFFKNNYKPTLSWGIDGRIFKLTDNGFETVKFNKSMSDVEKSFLYPLLNVNNNDVIGGTSTYFGNIVEYADSLLVVQTDDDCFRINGPITRWRTYPRSRNYENQLHVILDNCIEIYSFNHDFFLSQEDKKVGIEFIEMPTFKTRVA